MTAAITPAATIPVGETTHFAAITPDSESDLEMEDSDEASCSPAAPVVRPTPVFPSGNGLPVSEETRSSSQPIGSALQTTPGLSSDMQVLATAAEIASVEEIIEPVLDVEVPSLRKASLTNPEPCSSPELKQEKRRGKTGLKTCKMCASGELQQNVAAYPHLLKECFCLWLQPGTKDS